MVPACPQTLSGSELLVLGCEWSLAPGLLRGPGGPDSWGHCSRDIRVLLLGFGGPQGFLLWHGAPPGPSTMTWKPLDLLAMAQGTPRPLILTPGCLQISVLCHEAPPDPAAMTRHRPPATTGTLSLTLHMWP